MSDLKPCPFCGTSNEKHNNIVKLYDDEYYAYEYCNACGARVYANWNTRPIEDALQARITELKEIIDRIHDISMKKDPEFGLTYLYANKIIKQRTEIDMLKQENAKLEKLNSAALERLSYHACPAVPSRNNYGQPCNDSDDCIACWREYLGGKDE